MKNGRGGGREMGEVWEAGDGGGVLKKLLVCGFYDWGGVEGWRGGWGCDEHC